MKILDKIIIFCFSPCLEKWEYEVVKVCGWGEFIVEGNGISRRRVRFAWYNGFI